MKKFSSIIFYFLSWVVAFPLSFLPLINYGQTATITSKFNNDPIAEGNYIWFRAVFKLSGVSAYPVTIGFQDQRITSPAFNLSPPNITVTFYDTGYASTARSGESLLTIAPNGLSGFYFLSGCMYQVPAGGIAGGLDPVSWTGFFSSTESGVSAQWKWTSTVYSSFDNDYNLIGIKPTDDNIRNPYLNTDKAGTPENFKGFETLGGRGGGYSGTSADNIYQALPVTFSNFEARLENEIVNLYWSTATEINNDYFTVERSEDSKHFEPIARVKGAGNSSVLRNYREKDVAAFSKIGSSVLYYRIRQTDFDGKSGFSTVVSIRLSDRSPFFTVFPNPLSGHNMFFKGRFTCSGTIQISIRDISGIERFSKICSCKNNFLERIDVGTQLARGVYFISAFSETGSYMQRLVVD